MVTYALFSPNVASRQYALLEKRPPSVSVDAGGGGGAKGVTEKVRSFVTFFYTEGVHKKSAWTPISTHLYRCGRPPRTILRVSTLLGHL